MIQTKVKKSLMQISLPKHTLEHSIITHIRIYGGKTAVNETALYYMQFCERISGGYSEQIVLNILAYR